MLKRRELPGGGAGSTTRRSVLPHNGRGRGRHASHSPRWTPHARHGNTRAAAPVSKHGLHHTTAAESPVPIVKSRPPIGEVHAGIGCAVVCCHRRRAWRVTDICSPAGGPLKGILRTQSSQSMGVSTDSAGSGGVAAAAIQWPTTSAQPQSLSGSAPSVAAALDSLVAPTSGPQSVDDSASHVRFTLGPTDSPLANDGTSAASSRVRRGPPVAMGTLEGAPSSSGRGGGGRLMNLCDEDKVRALRGGTIRCGRSRGG